MWRCRIRKGSRHNPFESTQVSLLTVKENYVRSYQPVTVAARSKARTVFARSNAGVVGSKPTQCMDVYVRLFCVCAVLGSGLPTGRSLFEDSY
jgi:hypothetical protein